jgi:hypothetical protein
VPSCAAATGVCLAAIGGVCHGKLADLSRMLPRRVPDHGTWRLGAMTDSSTVRASGSDHQSPLRHPVFYPSLVAAYSVLALAAANPGEIVGFWVLRWPLVISLLVSLCAWLLLGAFSQDRDRQAFLTLMVVVPFFWYESFTLGMGALTEAAWMARPLVALLCMIAYLAGLTFLVVRLVPDLRAFTRFMTTFAAILVVWSAIDVLRHVSWRADGGGESNRSSSEQTPNSSGKAGPDIYLIVLDKYTGSRALKENFGFDNADFEVFLRTRGFVLPHNAQTNYIYTTLSLASLLNFRYLRGLPPEPAALKRTKAQVNRLVENNAVWQFLQARHYRFIFFPTEFSVTGRNRFADLQVPEPPKIRSEFEIVWRRGTLAEPIISWVCQHISCTIPSRTPFNSEAKLLEWKFDQLSRVPRWPREGRPLFVFAHLPIPHEPYVFNADCSLRPPFWPSFHVVEDETPEKDAYVAQIACLNRRLKGIVEHLLRDSPVPPVIILQSDHGHGRMPLDIPDIDSVTPDRVAERLGVFAAYYLPGTERAIIHDSITPVNVFRIVFRQYFQADLSPLPDETYWSSGRQLFRFTRVHRGQRWPH